MWDGSSPSSPHAAGVVVRFLSVQTQFYDRETFSVPVSRLTGAEGTRFPVSAMTLTSSLSFVFPAKCLVSSPSADLADRKPLTIVVCTFIYNVFFHWRPVT